MTWLWIALGSALGGVLRYGCSGAVARLVGDAFPWGTLAVNVTGCLLIGLFATLTETHGEGRLIAGPDARDFVMVGLFGGFTTFSAFSLQTLALMRDGNWGWASLYVLGSVALCLAGVWAGHALATAFGR